MALIRSMSHLGVKAPPPSPIPTATGSRSAANETLSEFLEKALQVPNLLLNSQELHEPSQPDDQIIDFRSLAMRETSSVERMLQAVREVGAFKIGCGGIINLTEMNALVKEAWRVFGILEERDTGFRKYLAGRREEIVWVRCQDERMEWARQYIGAQLYHSFSEKMEKARSKLDKLGEQLGQILVENAASHKEQMKRLQMRESLLSIYKYNQEEDKMMMEPKTELHEGLENDHTLDTLLSLHLPTKHCEFCVKSGPSRLSTFDAGPDTIIVTVGQQLEEWSLGEFKHVSGRAIYQPEPVGSPPSFSLELKMLFLNTNRSYKSTTYKRISLADQFLVALVLVFLYSIMMCKTSP